MAVRKALALFAAVLLFVLPGCRPAPGHPTLAWQVSPCQEGIRPDELAAWAKVEAQAEDGVIHLRQNLSYVCCAKVELSLERSGDLLRLVEVNTGQMCRCLCGYRVEARISGLPKGRYTVQVWGVKYEEQEPKLLGEVAVNL